LVNPGGVIVFKEFRNSANEIMKEKDEPELEIIESLRKASLPSVLKQILDFFKRFAVIKGFLLVLD
jgi:hypothetical protein